MATLLGALSMVPPGRDHATFRVNGIGQVEVTSSFPAGSFPTGSFGDSSGRTIYSVTVGGSDADIFRITDDPGPPGSEDLGPSRLVYFVLHPSAQPASVLAIAKYTGGSDCAYAPALIGPVRGKLKSWLQQEPIVNGQGGFYVGDLQHKRGFGLAAWSFLWEDGAHWGSHRYKVWLYRIDSNTGTSTLAFEAETKRKYVSGLVALKEFGLHYDNVLSHSPALGC